VLLFDSESGIAAAPQLSNAQGQLRASLTQASDHLTLNQDRRRPDHPHHHRFRSFVIYLLQLDCSFGRPKSQ